MSGKNRFSKSVEEMDAFERIALAKTCIRALTDRVLEVLASHESNKITFYSNILSEQIPRSHAARAFNLFQTSMLDFEIIRLLSLWESPDDNRESIPTAVLLLNDSKVVEQLRVDIFNLHANSRPVSVGKDSSSKVQPIATKPIRDSQTNFANEQAAIAESTIKQTISSVNKLVDDSVMESLRNTRDHLAHSLSQTRKEMRSTVNPMKYGDERKLLNDSIQIIENLYCWVNGTDFRIDDECRENSKKAAEELWKSCKFEFASR